MDRIRLPGRLPGQLPPLGLLGPNGQPLPPAQPPMMPNGAGGPMPPAMGPMSDSAPPQLPPAMPPMDPMMGGMAPPLDPMAMAGQMSTPPPPPLPLSLPVPPAPAYPEEPPDDGRPVYPAWLLDKDGNPKPPKKPTVTYIQSAVSSDETKYQSLLARFLDDLRFYRLEGSSYFDAIPVEDLELFTSAEPATQVNKVANMISGIAAMVQWHYCTDDEETAAQTLEDFCRHFLQMIDDQHQTSGNASIRWEQLWYALVYGRMVSRVLPDPTDPDFPWEYRLLDPATVFPTFGAKKGLVRVTHVYRESLDRVIQTFGDDPKLLATFKKDADFIDEDGMLDLNREGTMKEYWDPWYRWAEFSGTEVLPVTAHELGYVPFVYTIAPGEPGQASSPYDRRRQPGGLTAREIKAGYAGTASSFEMDMVYKGQSFFHAMKPVIRQEEATLSLLTVAVKQSINPPMGTENPYPEPAPPYDMRTGAQNNLRPGQKPVPLLASTPPADVAPLLTSMREQRIKGMLPDHVFGAQDGSNVSGFAVESLIAAAKDRIQPYISMDEQHLAGIFDMALRQYRDFGHLATADGSYPIPAQDRLHGAAGQKPVPPMPQMMQLSQQLAGGSGPVGAVWNAMGAELPDGQYDRAALTRGIILQMGTRPTVKLSTVSLQNLTALANVASMLNQGKMWSRAYAMEQLDVQNPRLMMQQILAEDAMTDPDMLKLVSFPEALWKQGNMDAFFAYYGAVVLPQVMQALAPASPGGSPPGGPPQVGPGGPQTAQGASQPMVGQGQQSPTGPGNGGVPPQGM